MPELPIILIGGGSHSRQVANICRSDGRRVLGYVSPQETSMSELGCYFGDDENFSQNINAVEEHELIIAIGRVDNRSSQVCNEVMKFYKSLKLTFAKVAHQTCYLARTTIVAEGTVLSAGVVINDNSTVGEHTLVNTGAIIEHDCKIGAGCHIAPGAIVCGGVSIGDGSIIGAGSVIIQGSTIPSNTLVKANSVINCR